MDRIVSIALLVGGIGLMVLGIGTTHSLTSDLSGFLAGSPTNQAVGMFLAGTVATVVGFVWTWRHWRQA